MTDKEKAIVMAYTGVCMLSGNKFQIFHKYVEKIMGRPVYTHEMAIKAVDDEIKEKAKADFIALCEEQEQEPKTIAEKINERLINEYISKVGCCDECFASVYCTVNGLRESRVPQDYCAQNIERYFSDSPSPTGAEGSGKE